MRTIKPSDFDGVMVKSFSSVKAGCGNIRVERRLTGGSFDLSGDCGAGSLKRQKIAENVDILTACSIVNTFLGGGPVRGFNKERGRRIYD